VKQRVSIRVFGNGQIKGVKHEPVIVVVAHGEGDNTFVFKIKDPSLAIKILRMMRMKPPKNVTLVTDFAL